MSLLFTLSHQTSVRLAEVAFLFILIAGVWMAVAWILQARLQTVRMIVAGVLIAGAGLLLIIAVHWGRFG